jgi:hypothetical protein
MPRFYFDIRAGAESMPDPEGLELDGLEAAEHEATQTALALGRDWLARVRELHVEVRDEEHRPRLTLKVALSVEWPG